MGREGGGLLVPHLHMHPTRKNTERINGISSTQGVNDVTKGAVHTGHENRFAHKLCKSFDVVCELCEYSICNNESGKLRLENCVVPSARCSTSCENGVIGLNAHTVPPGSSGSSGRSSRAVS